MKMQRTFKNNYKDFQQEILKRRIEYLIHFTPTINLYSILEQGKILSRAYLESLNIEQFDILDYVQFTDSIRYDDKNYINLSISGPNTFLFSKFRERTKNDPIITWCVLKISPEHIYESETLFAVTNAASNAAKRQYGISGDYSKFTELFSEKLEIHTFNGIRTLTRNYLRSEYTTDEQAEVLIKDEIPFESIKYICFENEIALSEAKAAMKKFDTSKFIVEPQIFNPRRYL